MTPERYNRIKQLFAEAIELEGQQRDAYLTKACRDDAELRSEVESLLRHDDSQTIIQANDQTLADFSRQIAPASSRRIVVKKLQGFRRLTKHLGAKGFLALGGLLACVLLSLLGYFANHTIHGYRKELRRAGLNEIVNGEVLALRKWLEHETQMVESWARSDKLRDRIAELVSVANQAQELPRTLQQSPLQQEIQAEIAALAGRDTRYAIWDRRHFLIADTVHERDRVGQSATPWGASILASVFEGDAQVFSFDMTRSISKLDASADITPHLTIVAPVRDRDGEIIAAMQIHDDDGREQNSSILQVVPLGRTGETYAFNQDGLMLTSSRFERQLRELGLIPDDPVTASTARIYLRDPGGDLTAGFRCDEPLESRPLTRMARLCVAGHDGDDLDGYRDYRGVQVVGAWRWLDDLKVGVATKVDVDEVEPGIQMAIWESRIVFGLITLCVGIALYSYYTVHRLRQNLGENRKLGQYRLERQIGEGGMGKVFKAQHELLKRPTAVKLLKPELVDRDSLARFEREACLVAQLEHFNTIRVYDYGVTAEGLLYFVMEYIDGFTLAELVALEGPLSPARTVFLLRQSCYSLREAHDAGLVHRDLKPGNIMVCQRSGDSDVVKVLDFGLVKSVATRKSQEITSTGLVAGTPQYIPPERLSDPQTNDPRSDLYSLGAVAFFLLTGRDAIEGDSLAEVLQHVINSPPERPSKHTSQQIPTALDDLVYHCLSKDLDHRPRSAADIIVILQELEASHPWSPSQAEVWWAEKGHLRNRD